MGPHLVDHVPLLGDLHVGWISWLRCSPTVDNPKVGFVGNLCNTGDEHAVGVLFWIIVHQNQLGVLGCGDISVLQCLQVEDSPQRELN